MIIILIIICICLIYDYHINHHNNLIACNIVPPCILALPQPFLPDNVWGLLLCCWFFGHYDANLVLFVFIQHNVTLVEFVFRQYIINLVVHVLTQCDRNLPVAVLAFLFLLEPLTGGMISFFK